MISSLHDQYALKIYSLMMKSFNQTDLNELYFELGVDIDAVPKPANKQKHVEYLMRYMFVRGRQETLTARLKLVRPHLNWADTYTLPVDINKQEASTFLSKKTYSSKNRIDSKGKILLEIEKDIYDKVFKHTPKVIWFLLSLVLSSLIGLIGVYSFKKDFWIDYGSLLVFAVVLGVIAVFPIIFTLVYKYLRSSTEYYDLRVNDRMKIKKSLQKRSWGNKFMSLFCYTLIGLLLETNLHQANRRKI